MNARFLWFKDTLAKIFRFLELKSKLDVKEIKETDKNSFKDLLDKSKPLRMIKKEEFSDELISQVLVQNTKIWVDNASEELNRALGLKNAKITMQSNAIKHIFKRHGINGELVIKNQQPPITNQDLRAYSSIVNNADIHGIGKSRGGEKVLISGKQINGYYIVVEVISTKHNELMLKTMYKENGKLENNRAMKIAADRLLSSKNESRQSKRREGQSISLDSFRPSAIESYTTKKFKNQEKTSKLKTMYKENGRLENNKVIREADRLLSSKNEPSIRQTRRQGTDLDSPSPSAVHNYTTKKFKNQEKTSKLDETTKESSKEAKEQWLKTFNLKSIDEDFIPTFTPEVKAVLEPILKDRPLKLNKKDLEKLENKGRIKYINKIKETLENPQIIFKDERGDLIFAREINNKLFLTNISREYKDEFLSVSISPKALNTIKNKLERAEVVLLDKLGFKLRDSSAHKAFTGVLSSTNNPSTSVIILQNETQNQEKTSKLKIWELENVKNEIKNSKIIIDKGFERSEVAGACDILESGGEVSKPSHLQIKYTANQDFGTNPINNIIPQNQESLKTERGQRQADRVSSAIYFKDPDSRGSVHNENITQNNIESKGYTWKVKANDENIINYGERDYGKGHRLLTAHSRTERDERGQLRREFKDLNFHNSIRKIIIPQNQNQSQSQKLKQDSKQESSKTSILEHFRNKNKHYIQKQSIDSTKYTRRKR